MKRTLRSLALLFVVCWLLPSRSTAAITVQPWVPIFKGIDFATGEADTNEVRQQKVFAFRIDLTDPDVEFFSTPSNGDAPLETTSQTTSQFLAAHGLQIAVNANFFSPCCSGPEPKDVLGLAMSRGEVVSPQVTSGTGVDILAITQTNRAVITNTATPIDVTPFWTAVAGSPRMLRNGVNVGGDPAAHPRTAAGISQDNRYLFFVIIDGRQTGWSDGATMTEVGDWLIRFGAWQGLNLDGGGSTAMVKQQSGTALTLNRPSGGVQRQNGNNIGVYAPLLAPGISAQPQSLAVLLGDRVEFSVGGYGTTPLRYQWRFNGSNIAGASGTAYTIASAQFSHTGTYDVVITNSVGMIVSAPATLHVNYALQTNSTLGGVITKSPNTPNHPPGSTVTLTAVPDPGYVFTGWSGDLVGNENPANLMMDGHKTVTASFSGFPDEIVIDNPQASFSGIWSTATAAANKYGTNYRTGSTTSSAKVATYRPYIFTPGRYAIYTWYPTELSRSTNAPWNVSHEDGTDHTRINQNINGGKWNLLFTGKTFARGTSGFVTLTNTTDARVIADAVKFVYGLPPTITAQPADRTIVVGQGASFQVAVQGTAPLFYQWYRNGVALPGFTNSAFTINNAQPSQAGGYTASVTNLFGTIVSSNAALVVNVPPSITGQPQSQSVAQGVNVTFNVSATGTAPLGYQWFHNSTAIPAATSSAYTRTNTQATDAGSYTVQVSNVAGSVLSSSATLTVGATPVAPVITANPSSRVIIAGRTLELKADANGTLPMRLQWLFNGAPLSNATNTSLVIPAISSAHAGAYQFTASNHVGTASSAIANITVHYALSAVPGIGGNIVKSPNAASYLPGSSVTVSAVPSSGFSFTQWAGAFNGTNNPVTITMSSNVALRAQFFGSLPEIIVDNPQATFTGVWTEGTSASGRFGPSYHFADSSSTITATATYRPNIIMPGKYNVHIWFPSGSNRASNAPWETVSEVTTNLTLFDQTSGGGVWQLISPLHEFTAGTNGFVRLSNLANSSVVIADAVRFAYAQPPILTSHPQSRMVQVGANVTFSVTPVATSWTYQWLFNDEPVAGATNASYSLSSVQTSNSGSYAVSVSNPAGTIVSSPAFLYVYSRPAFDLLETSASGVRFTVGGAPGTYAIEVSSNLVHWTVITNLTSGLNGFEFTDEAPGQNARFYRAVQVSP